MFCAGFRWQVVHSRQDNLPPVLGPEAAIFCALSCLIRCLSRRNTDPQLRPGGWGRADGHRFHLFSTFYFLLSTSIKLLKHHKHSF